MNEWVNEWMSEWMSKNDELSNSSQTVWLESGLTQVDSDSVLKYIADSCSCRSKWVRKFYSIDSIQLQGGSSGCTLQFVDIKLTGGFTVTELLFWCKQTVVYNLMDHPVLTLWMTEWMNNEQWISEWTHLLRLDSPDVLCELLDLRLVLLVHLDGALLLHHPLPQVTDAPLQFLEAIV